jgi:hypothetical protein
MKWGVLVGVAVYLLVGFLVTADGSYAYLYGKFAKNNPPPADWESHDVIYEVVSAHYQDFADSQKVKVDGVWETVYDTSRTMHLCVYGMRHGAKEPERYQINVPMIITRVGDDDRYALVSNAYFYPKRYVDDDCAERFRDDVVEITPQDVGTIVLDTRFGSKMGYDSRVKPADQIRALGFDIPRRYPKNGLPFVFVYGLENAQHKTPEEPHSYPTRLDWPIENKHVYIGFYDGSNKHWRIAGIYHETGNHRPGGIEGTLWRMADAAIAPLFLLFGMLVNLLGIRFG